MTQVELLKKIIQEEVILHDYKKDSLDDFEKGGWIFDFRKVMLDPVQLELITDVLYAQIADLGRMQIGGLESAAIPLITNLVQRAHQNGKEVRGFYVRKSRKKSGLYKIIEGELNDAPIILVDDVMNSASSFVKQVEVLESVGQKVHTILSIVRFRQNDAYDHLASRNIQIKTIFTLNDFQLVHTIPDFKKKDERPYVHRWIFSPNTSSHFQVIPRSTPVVYNDRVLFGSDDSYFRCLDINSGSECWRFKVGRASQGKSILSSPTVYEGVVFFGSYDGKLYALDIGTGKTKWVFDDCEWIGSSPAVNGDLGLIYVGLEHAHPTKKGSLVALDIRTGEKKWEYVVPALMHSSPLVLRDHNQVSVGGNEGTLYLFTGHGELVWKFETEGGKRYEGRGGFGTGDIKMSPCYDSELDQLGFSSMDGHAYVVDRKNGQLKYRVSTEHQEAEVKSGVYNSPIFASNLFIFGALDKVIYCCDKKSGHIVWKYRTGGRIFSAPVVSNETVFIGSNDGALYEIDLMSGEVRACRYFPDRIVNPVVIDDVHGCMLVRTNDSSVFCVEPHTYPAV